MIQVVAAHRFDHGLEGHLASFRMREPPLPRRRREPPHKRDVPDAQRRKCRECLLSVGVAYGCGPTILIERLNDGRSSASVCRSRNANTISQSAR